MVHFSENCKEAENEMQYPQEKLQFYHVYCYGLLDFSQTKSEIAKVCHDSLSIITY